MLGEDPPDTLTSRITLAIALRAAGDLRRAVPLFEVALADCVRVLGNDHPITRTLHSHLKSVAGR
ncbi:tetratricopeptide repeat protein [Actinoallomurus rhizosphaericola]|uniref:tetratricopeptide repeat protein n=1 Tax=Actinoallomurus rhizosphaericola TaxID=2952536 RepID=UPI003872DC51